MPVSTRRSDRLVSTPSASAPPRPSTTMASDGSRWGVPAIHAFIRLASGVKAARPKATRPMRPSARSVRMSLASTARRQPGVRQHRSKGNTAHTYLSDFRLAVESDLYGILEASDGHGQLSCGAPSPRRIFQLIRVRRIGLALACLLVTFCLLEVLVRLFVLGPGTLFAADPDIGKVPVKGTHVLWGTEGYGHTAYSNDGEITTPFADGAPVVVIGDSHTEALQVDDAAKFPSVAEAETFDAGHVNSFQKEADGSLRLVHRDLRIGSPSLGARIKHASALVNYTQLRFLRIAERRAETAAAPRAEGDADPAQAIEWATVPRQLELLHQAYPNVPVILILLPFVPRVDTGTVVADDPEYQRLLAIIRSTLHGFPGWEVVDPLAAFRSLADRGTLPRGFANSRPGTGHLNVVGHQVVGHLLADALGALRP